MLKELNKTTWYIRYNSQISEDIFERFKSYLNNLGLELKIHYAKKYTYDDFRESKYLRSGCTELLDGKSFCVDNNNQGIQNEIFISDYVIKINELEYEIC